VRGQRVNALALALDGLGEGEGIQAIAEGGEGADREGIGFGTGGHAIARRAGDVVAAAEPGADALFADELDRFASALTM
jgi:hypothetical protein